MPNQCLAPFLLITARADIGGGPKHVADLMASYNSRGLRFAIAAPADEFFSEAFKQAPLGLVPVPTRYFSVFVFLRLLLYCRLHNIEVVHSHGRGAGIYGRLLALFGLENIHTFHGAHAEPGLTGTLKVWTDRLLRHLTTRFINVGHDEFEQCAHLGITVPDRAVVIENGIPTASIAHEFDSLSRDELKREFGATPGLKAFGTLARLVHQKGIDRLFDYTPPEGVELLIAGPGEMSPADRARLHPRIRLIGETKTPIRFLRALDGYFSVARWEGLPLSVLEAMACGLPCVLSNVPGHFLFKDAAILFDNLDEFGTALVSADQGLGERAQRFVREHHDVELMASRTLAQYLSI